MTETGQGIEKKNGERNTQRLKNRAAMGNSKKR
ncbi:hypothetical protein A2U01_0065635, partial [Trifolium medium]|nr:hypothetical protein [Trifolium medium]